MLNLEYKRLSILLWKISLCSSVLVPQYTCVKARFQTGRSSLVYSGLKYHDILQEKYQERLVDLEDSSAVIEK